MIEMTLEKKILGDFIYDCEELKKYASKIDAIWFIENTGVISNRVIFEYLVNNLQGGYDAISVSEAFNSDASILELANDSRKWSSKTELRICIGQLAAKRMSIQAKNLIANLDKTGDLGLFTEEMQSIQDKANDMLVKDELQSLGETNDAYLDKLTLIQQTGRERGIQTPFDKINRIGGLPKGQVTTIFARPGKGKTTLGLNFGLKASKDGKKVLFVSTEMQADDLRDRLLSMSSGVSLNDIRINTERLGSVEFNKLDEAGKDMDGYYIYYQPRLKIFEFSRIVKVFCKSHKIDLVIVDYLQNLEANGFNTVEKLNNIASEMPKVAKENNVHIIALAQSNRESEKHQDLPKMSDIKGSGAIEQASDSIYTVYRNEDEVGENCYWLYCVKSRFGQMVHVPILFEKHIQRITDDYKIGRVLFSEPQKNQRFRSANV